MLKLKVVTVLAGWTLSVVIVLAGWILKLNVVVVSVAVAVNTRVWTVVYDEAGWVEMEILVETTVLYRVVTYVLQKNR